MAEPATPDSEVLELTEEALVERDPGFEVVIQPAAVQPTGTQPKPKTPAKPTKATAKPDKPKPAPKPEADPDAEAVPRRGFGAWLSHHLNESSAFAVSTVLHLVAILLLGLAYFPQVVSNTVNLMSAPGEAIDELAEIPELDVMDEPLEPIDPSDIVEQPNTENISEELSFSPFDDATSAAASMELSDFGLSSAPESLTTAITGFDGSGLTGRGMASRTALVRMNGGSEGSETAVASALAWLIEHQNPDGTWLLDHTGGKCQGRCGNPGAIRESAISGTALALLPFLGAGQTHKEGKYKEQVGKGLDALVRMGKPTPNGGNWMDGGNLYAHGIAAIVLCEAYAMTDDYRLMEPAQQAINFIVYAQDPVAGGWRYVPRRDSDTSVVGWQLMALKSAHMASLGFPATTIKRATEFLDAVSVDYGQGYGYQIENKFYKPSTTSVGLLCRMYLGWKRENETLKVGVERLVERGPSKSDFYYNYYANQVVFQYTSGQGKMWRQWNEKLRDMLVASQDKADHEKGSWFIANGHDSSQGGRLYMTALATMTLEVYYRHMPIYRAESVEQEFPE